MTRKIFGGENLRPNKEYKWNKLTWLDFLFHLMFLLFTFFNFLLTFSSNVLLSGTRRATRKTRFGKGGLYFVGNMLIYWASVGSCSSPIQSWSWLLCNILRVAVRELSKPKIMSTLPFWIQVSRRYRNALSCFAPPPLPVWPLT